MQKTNDFLKFKTKVEYRVPLLLNKNEADGVCGIENASWEMEHPVYTLIR
jgi:hypothetical protein